MRAPGVMVVLLALALPAQAQAVPTTEAELAEALYGCWTRMSWSAEIEAQRADPDFRVSSQMCLLGGLAGELHYFNCHGYGTSDCREILGVYELKDGKLWRDHGLDAVGGRLDNCDVTLEAARWLTLSNCQWVGGDGGATPIEDVVYERSVDL